jgi:hypothetical protein
MPSVQLSVCAGCKEAKKLRCRGLCANCYYRKPGVRAAAPRKKATGPAPEPTAEEVEATVREQSRRLPVWWWDSWNEIE